MPFLFLLLVSCASTQRTPDTLYSEAVWSANEAQRAEKESYLAAYEYYKSAGEKIEQYIANNPSSEKTTQLKDGTLLVGAHTFEHLNEKVIPLAKRKAKTEGDPTVRELFISKGFDDDLLTRIDQLVHSIDDVGMRVGFLPDLAVAYDGVGHKEKALRLLAEALEAAEQNNSSTGNVIVAYAKVGKVEQAISMARAGKQKNSVSESLGEISSYLADKWPSESVDELM